MKTKEEVIEYGTALLTEYGPSDPREEAALKAHIQAVTDPASPDYDDMEIQGLMELNPDFFEELVSSRLIAFHVGFTAAIDYVQSLINN